jgi:plastocyanin
MKPPQRRIHVALSALAVVLAACSSTVGAPTPTFSGGSTVGMPGMNGMAAPPQAPPATTAVAPTPVSGTAVDIVKAGDTVTWANHDEEPHTIAADDGSFHSPGMGTNATYSFTFTKPGSYGYTCSIHPFMHGTVVVTA